MTYDSVGKDGQPTYGGYSSMIVVDQKAPLLCWHHAPR